MKLCHDWQGNIVSQTLDLSSYGNKWILGITIDLNYCEFKFMQ